MLQIACAVIVAIAAALLVYAYWKGKNLQRRSFFLLGIVAMLIIFDVACGIAAEYYWFSELGYSSRYLTELKYRVGVFVAMAIPLGMLYSWQIRSLAQNAGLSIRLTYVGIAGIVIGIVVASFFGAESWETVALYLQSSPVGKQDPVFGLDHRFYLFTLPLWKLVQSLLWVVLLVATTLMVIGTGCLLRNKDVERCAFVLPILSTFFIGGVALMLLGVEHGIDIFDLVIKGSSAVVSGASYEDVHWYMPAHVVSVVLCGTIGLALMIMGVFGGVSLRSDLEALNARDSSELSRKPDESPSPSWWKNLPWWGYAVPALFGLKALVFWAAIPALVYVFISPAQLAYEKPYIERGINNTRDAFTIGARVVPYDISNENFTAEDIGDPTFSQVRVWGVNQMRRQLAADQGMRGYYMFGDVDVDRVCEDNVCRQIMISAREISPEQIPNLGWQQKHLMLTHGIGAAAALVGSKEGKDPHFLLAGIPPTSHTAALRVEDPRIYYGEVSHYPVYVHSGIVSEHDYPRDEQVNATTVYRGSGGIKLSDFWARVVFAYELSDWRILMGGMGPDSKVLWRRSVAERTRTLLPPSMSMDRDAYIIPHTGTYVWMLDGYTSSKMYPYSASYSGEDERSLRGVNYLRNSAKIVIDANHGTMTIYVMDDGDPIIRTYRKIFPELFRDGSSMPDALKAHRRYPEGLFNVQAAMYGAFHVTDPDTFFLGEDMWSQPEGVDPYYITAQLPGMSSLEFMLIQPSVIRTQNGYRTVGLLVGRSDGDHYGELVVYTYSKAKYNLNGPSQVESLINANPDMSAALTLWAQKGSVVQFGDSQLIPVRGKLFFIRSVYVLAERASIPQLVRVVVGQVHHNGTRLEWAPTLGEALNILVHGKGNVCTAQEPRGERLGDDTRLRDAAAQARTLLEEALK